MHKKQTTISLSITISFKYPQIIILASNGILHIVMKIIHIFLMAAPLIILLQFIYISWYEGI